MAVNKFEKMLKNARQDFRLLVEQPHNSETMKKVLKYYLDQCCSSFEEQCLTEHLQEEFANYVKSLSEAKGE